MIKPKKAIILIAGQGTRMRPLTYEIPKCLIELNKKTILINALENLEKNNIEEVILAVGYLKDKIKKAVGKKFGKMNISYIDNDLYDKTNNSYSLWLALKGFNQDLLLLEGDIFFEEKLLKEFLKDKRENLTIVEKYQPWLDGTFVEIGDDKKVVDWVHKDDRPEGFTLRDKYKTVNIHKFSKDFIRRWLVPFLNKHIEAGGGIRPIEFVFSEIIKNNGKIYVFDAKEMLWIEVDDANDFKRAKEIFLER